MVPTHAPFSTLHTLAPILLHCHCYENRLGGGHLEGHAIARRVSRRRDRMRLWRTTEHENGTPVNRQSTRGASLTRHSRSGQRRRPCRIQQLPCIRLGVAVPE